MNMVMIKGIVKDVENKDVSRFVIETNFGESHDTVEVFSAQDEYSLVNGEEVIVYGQIKFGKKPVIFLQKLYKEVEKC